jgi:hypothetical protein
MNEQPQKIDEADILMHGPKEVKESDILDALKGEVETSKGTYTQSSGMRIILAVGIFSFISLGIVTWMWFANKPVSPDLSALSLNSTQGIADAAKILDVYKLANEIVTEQPQKWFDNLFVKILYPLTTLLLGYFFGAKVTEEKKPKDNENK